jgi:cysteine desulfurase
MDAIYLDYNATTPIAGEVAEAMAPYLYEHFGNPSSAHMQGITAKRAVETARRQVADLLNCMPEELVFTSGGTESNNFAIKGTAFENRDRGTHIITSAIEHPAVSEVCRYLENYGFRTSYIPVDGTGLIDIEKLEHAITPDTILISVMHANNEVGTIQPIAEIAEFARNRGITFHTDAAQSIGKIPVDVEELGVDLLSVAGHKMYAPKGVGALFVRTATRLEKFMHGAGQERNLRAGTENVLEIVGLGKACEIAARDRERTRMCMKAMRNRLHEGLKSEIRDIRLNGHPALRLPNTLSIGFRTIEAPALLNELIIAGVSASAGSACHADRTTVSHVLEAMHVPMEYAVGTLRLSVGRMTTPEEIDRAVKILAEAVKRFSKT